MDMETKNFRQNHLIRLTHLIVVPGSPRLSAPPRFGPARLPRLEVFKSQILKVTEDWFELTGGKLEAGSGGSRFR